MPDYKEPKRIFEDTGTVDPDIAYHVELQNVTNSRNHDLKTMVDMGRYFSIFAPRQSGKTTFFEDFCEKLEREKTYVSIMLDFQNCKTVDKKTFYQRIQKELYSRLLGRLEDVECSKLDAVRAFLDGHDLNDHISFHELFEQLNQIIDHKKIVIFIDEFDGAPIDELENFLTTLRSLYQKYKKRRKKALYSVGLVGIRNITKLIVGGVSPFNIADTVKLSRFSLENIRDLYAQYTEDTNQPFEKEAVHKVFEETSGQPWLVNRLGAILTADVKPGTTDPITAADVEKGIDILLYEENMHFDNITEKARQYKETFIDVVFDGVETIPGDEEQSLLLTHGLVTVAGKRISVGNPIYKKRFTKTFFRESGAKADISMSDYYSADGYLNMAAILSDFEEYIVQIGVNAFYHRKKPYEKTGQFLLTAWLYQFVEEGKGELRYELPSGLGRLDILLTYRGRKYIIETKINRSNIQATLDKAIIQISRKYMSTERVNEGYIVIFDLKTTVGESAVFREHEAGSKEISSLVMGIGRPS